MFKDLSEVGEFENWLGDEKVLVRFSPSCLGPYSDDYVIGQLKWSNRAIFDTSDLREQLEQWRGDN